jgi:hypothetical protein
VAGLALWALGRYVFKGTVPDVVASWVYAILPSLLTFGAGYLAKHTARPVTAPAAAPLPPGYPPSVPPLSSMPPTAAETQPPAGTAM